MTTAEEAWQAEADNEDDHPSAAEVPPTLDQAPYADWSELSLFGHKRLLGYVEEAEVAGSKFFKITRVTVDGLAPKPEFYGPTAVYSLIPTSLTAIKEEINQARSWRTRTEPHFKMAELTEGEDSDEEELGVDAPPPDVEEEEGVTVHAGGGATMDDIPFSV